MLRVMAMLALVVLFVSFGAGALAQVDEAGASEQNWFIVYSSYYPNRARGYLVPVNADAESELTYGGTPIVTYGCSPNGSYFVFAMQGTLHVMSVRGDVHRTLDMGERVNQDSIQSLSVSNDGGVVAVHGGRGIDVLRVADSRLLWSTVLWRDTLGDNPALSPDGTQIAYVTVVRDLNSVERPYVYAADMTQPGAALVGYGLVPQWMNNGHLSYIAFGPRHAEDAMVLNDFARGLQAAWGDLSALEFSREFAWSPDGSAIAYTVKRAERSYELRLMSRDHSEDRLLASDPHIAKARLCFLSASPEALFTVMRSSPG
jgi:hypothetical protein